MSSDGQRFAPADDWSVPLGRHVPAARGAGWSIKPLPALAALLALGPAALLLYAAFVDDPLGGQPIASVEVVIPEAKPGANAAAPHEPTAAPIAAEPATTGTLPAGGSTITIIDGSSGKRQEVTIPAASSGSTPRSAARMPGP